MKKLIAVCFSLIMLFNITGTTVFADEVTVEEQFLADGNLTDTEIIELSVLAFPEYEQKIRGNNIPTDADQFTRNIDYVVFENTRNISDTTSVTYQELSSGAARSLVYARNSISSTSETGYTDYTMTVWVKHSWSSQTFYVNDFMFRINTGTNVYDKIISTGSMSGDVLSKSFNTPTMNETASANASASYNAMFAISFGGVDSTHLAYLEINVGDDGYSISAN